MLRKQEALMQTDRAAQMSKDQQHMTEADQRRTTYEIGEYVLVEYQP